MNNSFVLYTNYAEILQGLTMEEMGYIFKAILEYQATGKIIDLPKQLLIPFRFIKNQMDIDKEKYNQIKQARSEAGKMGGAPKGNKNAQNKQNKQNSLTKNNQNKQNNQNKHNDNVNDNVNNNENVIKDKEKEINKEKETEKQTPMSQAQQPPALLPDKPKPKPKPIEPKTPQAEVYEYFAAKYRKLTGIKYLSKKEDFINLAKLIKDYGTELVKQKINWLEIGCLHPGVFWFATDKSDFTIGALKTQWNAIIPKLTAEQKKEEERRRKEEEMQKRIIAGLEAEEQIRRQANVGNIGRV